MTNETTIRIKLAGREGYQEITIPKAVIIAEITVAPESGDAALTAVYQNSGGNLKVDETVVPNAVLFTLPR